MNYLTIELKPGTSVDNITVKISDDMTSFYYTCSQELSIGSVLDQAMKAFMHQKTHDMLREWRRGAYELPY